MLEFLNNFLATRQFIPHGHCYLWKPGLVGLHVVSDLLIALAYYSIPVMLVYLVHKRRDVPFHWIFLMFGAFIIACGTSHVMEVWTLWYPTYWLSGSIKVITAIISLYTAMELVPLLPKVLALPSPAQLKAANLALENEITSRKQVELELQKEQEFLKVLLDNLEAGIVACDAQGVLTLFNQATLKFHGLPEQPLPADQWAQHYNLYLPDGKTCMKKEDVPLFRALQGECVSNVEMMIVPKHGTARTLLASGQALFDAQGKKLGAVAAIHDITSRKQAEEALRKSEAKNRALLNAIPDLILCISKDGTYLECKPPKAFDMLVSGSDLIGKTEYEVLPPAVAQQRMHYVEQALSTGEPQIFEYQLLLNGNICDEEARIVASGDSEALVIVRDITERKRVEQHIRTLNAELEQRVSERTAALSRSLEELASEIAERKLAESALRVSEAKFRRLVDSNIVGVIISDFSGNIKEANNAFLQMVGYTREELVSGKIRWREITPDEYLPKDERAIEQINCSGACAPFEKEYIRKDGSRVPILLGCALLEGAQDTAICFVLDLSERKQAEDQLKASLYEKEVLLKEIHHRVKNNMQVICSLLNLQSASISDPKTLELLQEGQNRVASMALVHEQLYESEDLARIDFGDYIQNLAANLLSSYDVSSDAIALKINVDNVLLGVDAAIPCGLIINELVSNSLKYAFPPSPQRGLRISPGNQGEIRIDFHAENDNHLHLTVSDNGVGFPQDLDFQNTETLGLQLVTALTGQLSGTIKLERNMGTKFKITFPH